MAKTPPVVGATGTGKVDLLYNPYQDAFLRNLQSRLPDTRRAFHRLSLFSGRRGGKTLIGALGTCLLAKRPGQTLWACAPSYPKLHDYVIPAIAKVLPPAWLAKPFSAQHYEWTLRNGTVLQARSLDDVQRGRGPGLDGLWIDEAREVAPIAYMTLVPALVDKGGVAIVTTTPNGFDWCWEKFWKPASEAVPGYWACKYRSLDNPKIDPEEVEQSRREMDPLFFQQEWEAEFVSFTGAIFGTSLVPQILDTDEQIKNTVLPEWPRVAPTRPCLLGLDPGSDHPFAAVQLVSTTAGLVVVGEYEQRDTSAMAHTAHLRFLLARDNPGQPFEPSVWAIDRSQKQMAIELAQHGIYATGAENDVMAGIQRVKSWLFGRRLWFIRARCPKLLAAMFSYRYAENTDNHGAARKEKVVKVGDDLPDALRYALMSWPELPYPDAPLPVRDLSTLGDEHRWALERMQRHDHPEVFHDEDKPLDEPGMLADSDHDTNPVGDFWG